MNEKQKNIIKNLERIDAIKESDIDYSDIPDCSKLDWTKFKPLKVNKQPITIRLDQDLLEYFKSYGRGYQERINAILREYFKHQHTV